VQDVKILVCGSIGYGGKERIKEIQKILKENGFTVLDQLSYDYSEVDDFRGSIELCKKIVEKDLELIEKADIIVLLSDMPSFGAMAEAVIASLKGKTVISYSTSKIRSPWPLYFSKKNVNGVDELIEEINSATRDEIRTLPNIYGNVELELLCPFTCICPVTGVRDYGVAHIRYIPNDRILEYESLKSYFHKFRDLPLHHEAVAKRIFNDLDRVLQPQKLEIILEFEERSGIKARVKIDSERAQKS
jgi:7-cyano-7-deazaguanine reductase